MRLRTVAANPRCRGLHFGHRHLVIGPPKVSSQPAPHPNPAPPTRPRSEWPGYAMLVIYFAMTGACLYWQHQVTVAGRQAGEEMRDGNERTANTVRLGRSLVEMF